MSADPSRPGLARLLKLTAVIEAGMGLALIAVPVIVVRLLLGGEIDGAGVGAARIAGVALLALGVACWPARSIPAGAVPALCGMLPSDNGLVTIYLLRIGMYHAAHHDAAGPLLWPAVVLHALITVACVKCVLTKTPASPSA